MGVHGKRDGAKTSGTEMDEGFGANSVGLEVDPTRLTDADSLDVNKYKLMTTCQTFLESIYRSSSRCPASLKEVLDYVGSSVGSAYPNKQVQGMGGFYFLRLFCPAITSPQEYLVLECLYQYNSVHGKRDAAKAEGTDAAEPVPPLVRANALA